MIIDQMFNKIKAQLGARLTFGLAGLVLAQGAPLGFIFWDGLFRNFLNTGSLFQGFNFQQFIYNHQFDLFYIWSGTSFFFTGFGVVISSFVKRLESTNDIKNKFIGIVAHDLRGPISNIKNMSAILREDSAIETKERMELINNIYKSSHDMIIMTNDLLDHSALENGHLNVKFSNVSFKDLVTEVFNMATLLAKPKNIQLLLEYDDRVSMLSGDSVRLNQVIYNLLSNAIKFSPLNSQVKMIVKQDNGKVQLEVLDQGPGVSENQQLKLFKPFNVTKNKTTAGEKSTGLGLFIAKKIITLHDGEIYFKHRPEGGSCFGFSIPTRMAQVIPLFKPSGQLLRILFIEDSEDQRILVKRVLQKTGHHVDFSFDGKSAIEKLSHQTFDLVFVDYYLGDMTGPEVVQAVRKNGLNPNFIAMTATSDADDLEIIKQTRFSGTLRKPFKPIELISMIDRPANQKAA